MLLRRLVRPESPFEQARDVFCFLATAAFSCAVASSTGATSLWLTGIIPGAIYRPVWFTWWLGDAAGMLILAPTLYCWWRQPRLGLSESRLLELAFLVALTAVTAELLFGGWIASPVIDSLPYLVIPALLWAAFRFGPRETASLAVLLSLIAIAHTWGLMSRLTAAPTERLSALAPFVDQSTTPNDSLLMLQIFVGAVAATAIVLAAAVTERNRSEGELRAANAALADAEAQYHDLYEDAPDCFASVSAETARIVQCNRTFAEALGYSREEVLGRPVFDIYDPGCLAEAHRTFEQFRTTGVVRNAELQMRRKDGSKIDVILNVSALRDETGKILRSRSVWRDISERKQVETALRESEERLRDLYEEAPIAYVKEDLESRFISANRAAQRILGLKPEEVVGTVGLSLVPKRPDAQRIAREQFAIQVRGAETRGVVVELQRKDDGKPVWIEIWAKPEPGGKYTRTMFLDVTDRVLMEREKARLAAENMYLQEEIKSVHNFEEIIGQSPALLDALEKVNRVAKTDATVLITGETGTGKELIARAIHSASPRRDKPLIKLNCAALPAGLVESELFGHEKGAFSGAISRRVGRFELANGGTIFLDEVGEVPLDTQVKLLRVLQEREFERVGGSHAIKVDVRVIAATNRDLVKSIREGKFREDLYYPPERLPDPPSAAARPGGGRAAAGELPGRPVRRPRRAADRFGRKGDHGAAKPLFLAGECS